MRGPLSIVAGLVLGVVAAGLLLAGIVALAPDESSPSPTPAPALASAIPTPSESASASASSAASPAPIASASPSPAASGAAFQVREPAPALYVQQVGGGTVGPANREATLSEPPSWGAGARQARTSSR